MDTLGKICGGVDRIKLMRLFLFHEKNKIAFEEIKKRTLIREQNLKRELRLLEKAGFLKKKKIFKQEERTLKSGKVKTRKVKRDVWYVNEKFPLREALKTLLLDSELIQEKEILKRIRKAGKLKLLILSGLFLKDDDREVDMLIVLDKGKKSIIDAEIKKIESEIGKELTYALFESDAFKYRIEMYDKLVRDVLENPHKVLYDKKEILW